MRAHSPDRWAQERWVNAPSSVRLGREGFHRGRTGAKEDWQGLRGERSERYSGFTGSKSGWGTVQAAIEREGRARARRRAQSPVTWARAGCTGGLLDRRGPERPSARTRARRAGQAAAAVSDRRSLLSTSAEPIANSGLSELASDHFEPRASRPPAHLN